MRLAVIFTVLGGVGLFGQAASAFPATPPIQPVGMLRAAEMTLLPMRLQAQLQVSRAARIALAAPAPVAMDAADTLNATCTVRQIQASQAPGGIDPKLAFLKSQLSKEPFNAYKSFKLLQENELALTGGAAQSLALVTRQTLGLAYKEKLSVAGGKTRMRMQMTLANGDKKVLDTLYAIDEGGTLLQAGQRYQDGTFVLAITCHTR